MCFNIPTLPSHSYMESYICVQRVQAETVFLVISSLPGVDFFLLYSFPNYITAESLT